MKTIFRFYEELNDFLPAWRRGCDFAYEFSEGQTVKDAIEAQGVPHAEVDLILVNGESVDFSYRLRDQDRISVYPVFESFDVTSATRLRARPLRRPAFVLDVHLGRLARRLRLLGFGTIYRNDYDDREIVEISVREKRIILTRDRGLLQHRLVTHGRWLRNTEINAQVREVIERFDLRGMATSCTRCPRCNGLLKSVAKEEIRHGLPAVTSREYDDFRQCESCGQVYWRGAHWKRLQKWLHGLGIDDFFI